MNRLLLTIIFSLILLTTQGAHILIPMDNTQRNHLKAYGIAFWTLQREVEISWLLNYRGGSFMCRHHSQIENELVIRGVSYEVIADVQAAQILNEISSPEVNMDEVRLHEAPKIAVYTPKNRQPWDDAVTLALTYAEIPFDKVYDIEIVEGSLPMYDWLHLHHEDFTGQYGKFWRSFRNAAWYQEDVRSNEETARMLGFQKVSQLKLAVAQKIRDFVSGGGFLFSMCSAPDSFDAALAAEGVDIVDVMFDGDPMDPNAQQKLNFSNTLAFENFEIVTNPYEYEISSIDVTGKRPRTINEKNDFFTLFDFSAKWDPVPTMLCQNHLQVIKGFMGQTTAFDKDFIKSNVLELLLFWEVTIRKITGIWWVTHPPTSTYTLTPLATG